MQALEKRWSAGERDVHLRMRALARYMPRGEHEALAEGLLSEQRLRQRIQVRSVQAATLHCYRVTAHKVLHQFAGGFQHCIFAGKLLGCKGNALTTPVPDEH